MLPIAAAHMVDIPRSTPRLVSIASPARIMTALSIMPKPTKGTAVTKATRRNCSRVGSSTLVIVAEVSLVVVVVVVAWAECTRESRLVSCVCCVGDSSVTHPCQTCCSPNCSNVSVSDFVVDVVGVAEDAVVVVVVVRRVIVVVLVVVIEERTRGCECREWWEKVRRTPPPLPPNDPWTCRLRRQ